MWHFVKNKDGNSYTISCEDDEALVLDVYSGADEDEANVWVWSRNGSNAQKWEILDNNGNYCLKPRCSTTKVLDTPGGKNGTQNAQIYSYNSGHGAEMNIIEVNPTEVELQNDKMVSSGNYNGHRYEILDQKMTWSDAKRACEAAGGYLVSITDAEEQKFIETLLEKSGLEHYWIGMYRNQDVYMWLTEEKSDYSNWNTGEPNGLSEGRLKEYCTEILNTSENKGKWNDLNNDPKINIGIICEYDSIKDYTRNYDANGGTNAPEKITDQQDAVIKISKDAPIRSGYEFIGWSTDKNATTAEYQPGSEIELTKDITLYAVWEKLEATGTCGEKLSWKLNKQGVLTIYGDGAMKNYTYKSEMPWYVCQNKIKSIVIEKGVTTIGDYAFYGMTDATEITIPEGVKTIGAYAFKNSTKITNVTLPNTLTKLGGSAFYGCSDLSELVLPEGMTEIGAYAFKNCTNVNKVSLPTTLNVIGESAFYECNHIKSIEIPKSVNKINNYAFSRCAELGTVIFKENAPEIAEYAFSKVKANAYYPGDNKTWTQDRLKNYGGTLTWSETK